MNAVVPQSGRSAGAARPRGTQELLARGVKPAVTADTCARLVALPRPHAPESRERSRVLLTDAQDRSSLAACRSLRRAGYDVDAVANSRPAAAHWSRSCDRRLVACDPRQDEARFVEELREIARTAIYQLLVTGSDASLLAVSRHRGRLRSSSRLAAGAGGGAVRQQAGSRRCRNRGRPRRTGNRGVRGRGGGEGRRSPVRISRRAEAAEHRAP